MIMLLLLDPLCVYTTGYMHIAYWSAPSIYPQSYRKDTLGLIWYTHIYSTSRWQNYIHIYIHMQQYIDIFLWIFIIHQILSLVHNLHLLRYIYVYRLYTFASITVTIYMMTNCTHIVIIIDYLYYRNIMVLAHKNRTHRHIIIIIYPTETA